ncbi:MAG: hypothetical protein ACI9V8_000268 [Urechidicola sp.]|jgi:hypothetical protein
MGPLLYSPVLREVLFSLIAMDGKYVVFAGAKSSHEKTTIFRDTLLSIITDVY